MIYPSAVLINFPFKLDGCRPWRTKARLTALPCSAGVDLIFVIDTYHRLHQQTSTDHADEVSRTGGKGRQKVHHSAFAEIAFAAPL